MNCLFLLLFCVSGSSSQETTVCEAVTENDLKEMSAILETLTSIQSLAKEDHERKLALKNYVAFSGRQLAASGSVQLRPMRFSQIEMNVGEAFDPQTGIFTVVQTGYYHIQFSIVSKPVAQLRMVLYWDSTINTELFLRMPRESLTSERIIYRQLQAKQQLWIELISTHGLQDLIAAKLQIFLLALQ